MTYITVIGTDPQYGHNVLHSAAQPWAVAVVEINQDGTKKVLFVYSRHATYKGAKVSCRCRQKAAA